MDDACISFTDNRLSVRDCLVVRLGGSGYVVRDGAMFSDIQNVHAFSHLPSLWQWIKLWWRWRHTRSQKPVKAVFDFTPDTRLKEIG